MMRTRLPVKIFLIIFLGGTVILHHYHQLSNAWVASLHNFNEFSATHNKKSLHIINQKTNASTTDVAHINNSLTLCVNQSGVIYVPPLFVITATYRRPEQIAELMKLSHTLMLVPNVYWLVIEDAVQTNHQVDELLKKTNLQFEYFTAPMPIEYKNVPKIGKPRGVSNRNRGLQWIRANATTGVFYFADDDNAYDLKLFQEMRYTKKVSMWPVGLVTQLGLSSPVVKNGAFIGFYDGWVAGRKFPVDMAGFAVSVKFLLERPEATMPFTPGYEEDGFLKSLVPFDLADIELHACNCTKILVWHTQTKQNGPSEGIDMSKYADTNIYELKQIIV